MKKNRASTHIEARSVESTVRLRDQADRLIATWRSGNRGSAYEAFRKYPELLSDRSIVLDLALEDYCLRRDNGDKLEPATFRERFDSFGIDIAGSIERLIEVEELVERECLSRPTFAWPQVGEELGDLTILEELGRGGLARAYLCQEKTVGDRLVVAKLSSRETNEAHRLGKLQHPCIVEVFSARQAPGGEGTLICMPYHGKYTLWHLTPWLAEQDDAITGKAFASWMIDPSNDSGDREGRFVECNREQLFMELFRDVAKGLDHAHHAGVVHGDIKGSNVLLTASGAKLIDFNLARNVGIEDQWLGGTLPYLAPETLAKLSEPTSSDGDDGGQAADIFAFGITMAEVVSGIRPTASHATLAAHDLRVDSIFPEQLKLVSTALESLPNGSGLSAILTDCTRPEPKDRPSAGTLSTRLSEELSRSRVKPQPATRFSRRAAVAALAITGIAMVGRRAWPVQHDPVARLQQGVRLLQAEQYDRAIEALERVPESDSLYQNAQYSLSWAFMLSGYFNEANATLDALSKIKGNDLIDATIGYWYAVQGEYDTGIASYDRMRGKHRGARPTLNNYGCCLWLGSGALPELEQRDLGYSKLTMANSEGHGSDVVRRNLGLLITHDLLLRPHFVHDLQADLAAKELLAGVPSREDILVATRLYGALATITDGYFEESQSCLDRLLKLRAAPLLEDWELDPAFRSLHADTQLNQKVREATQRVPLPEIGILTHPYWMPVPGLQLG